MLCTDAADAWSSGWGNQLLRHGFDSRTDYFCVIRNFSFGPHRFHLSSKGCWKTLNQGKHLVSFYLYQVFSSRTKPDLYLLM